MRIEITNDQRFLYVTSAYPYELNIIRFAFTKEVNNAWLLRKKSKLIDTERTYINDYGYMPVGLWCDLIQVCKANGISVTYSDEFIKYLNSFAIPSFDDFKAYVDDMFADGTLPNGKPFRPYTFQVTATWNLLRFKKCTAEISTSAGKTLISFIYFKYLMDKCNVEKILYIVPSVDLAIQSAEKYQIYENWLGNDDYTWKSAVLHSKLKAAEKRALNTANIIFATFQSLANKQFEFFKGFTTCIVDECHHAANANSIQKTLLKCTDLEYSIGITGTYPKPATIENFNLKSYIGPHVYTLTSDALINEEKQATPVYIIFQLLDWCDKDGKQMLWQSRNMKSTGAANIDFTLGNKLFRQEQKFINASGKRMKHIADMAIKMANNTLILFGDIKGGYGKRIADYITQYSDKTCYYIDGTTPSEQREYYKQQCEEDTTGNTVLVASIGTFGEGIDICNIWSIFLVNSAKSERLVRQICGRGFRKYPGKDKTVIYDFVDDLRYSETDMYYDNYIWTHYKERNKIYKEQKFPVYEQKITLKDNVFGFS